MTGAPSNDLRYQIEALTLSAINPATQVAGSAGFTMTATGAQARVRLNLGDDDTALFNSAVGSGVYNLIEEAGADFDVFESQIRAEYAHIPDEHFRHGRRTVLEHFLSFPRIYAVSRLSTALEDPARQNLERRIRELAA